MTLELGRDLGEAREREEREAREAREEREEKAKKKGGKRKNTSVLFLF